MKKAGQFALLVLAAAAFWAINPHMGHARMIGTNPTGSSADQFCVGGRIRGNTAVATTEVCVDASGNVIPTTTAVATLGTSSLQWLQGWIQTVTATTVSATSVNATNIVPSDTTGSRSHMPNVSSVTLRGITPTAIGDWFAITSQAATPVLAGFCTSTGTAAGQVAISSTVGTANPTMCGF